jgi:hypothetical protein
MQDGIAHACGDQFDQLGLGTERLDHGATGVELRTY